MKNSRKQKTRSSKKQKTGSGQKQKIRSAAPAKEGDEYSESITLKPVALHSEGAGMIAAKQMESTAQSSVEGIQGLTIGGQRPGASAGRTLTAQVKSSQEIMAEAHQPSLQGQQDLTHDLPAVMAGEVEHEATQAAISSQPVVTFGGPRPPIKSGRDVPKE